MAVDAGGSHGVLAPGCELGLPEWRRGRSAVPVVCAQRCAQDESAETAKEAMTRRGLSLLDPPGCVKAAPKQRARSVEMQGHAKSFESHFMSSLVMGH